MNGEKKQNGLNSPSENLFALAKLVNPGGITSGDPPNTTLMANQYITLIYSPTMNQLSTFKNDGGNEIPCTSRVFLETIKHIRLDGHKFPLKINGYEMLDKDVENLIRLLDRYIKSASAIDARPDERRKHVLGHIDEYARKWTK